MNNAVAKNKTQITIGLDLGYPALPDNQDKTGRGNDDARRARMILGLAGGQTLAAVSRSQGCSVNTVKLCQ